ncbi:MAG: MIP/aquaporin family protein [Nocardioides sp.]
MRKYAVEFIGTFFLVLTVVCAVNAKTGAELAPIGIGAVLMTMIYAGGHISGAHYNPAVSVAAFIRGRLPAAELGPYIGAQLAGAAVAGLIGGGFLVDTTASDAYSGKALAVALVAEFLFTFALAWVVLNVATSRDHEGNGFYGLAIGFTVMAGAFAVGGLSGGAFNPAVGFGISVGGVAGWANIWIYLLAPTLGGAAAGFAFKAINPEDA